MLRLVVVPVLAPFLLCSGVALFAAFRPRVRPPRSAALSGGNLVPFVRYVAVLAVGGYVAFLAVVFVFSTLIVGQPGALRSAVRGGAFLLAVAIPVFALMSWAFGRRST